LQESIKPFVKDVIDDKNSKFPVVVEIDPTLACDLSCPYCISLLREKQQKSFSLDIINRLLDELFYGGTQAVILIGGGEPLLHPKISDIIDSIFKRGLKLGVTTNGTQLKKYSHEISNKAEWIRVSINAASLRGHTIVSPPKKGLSKFTDIIEGISNIAQTDSCKIGWSYLIVYSEEFNNIDEIAKASQIAKDIGCNYIEYKPMVDFAHKIIEYPEKIKEKIKELIYESKLQEDKRFRVILSNSLRRIFQKSVPHENIVNKCYISQLRTLITPAGCYVCPYYRDNEKYNYGTITTQSNFKSIWNSNKKNVIFKKLDPNKNCNFFCIRRETNYQIELWKKNGAPVANRNFYDPFI
jgi:MoaA/NifB/PqqE/SkfB family radical SAM enzyme